MNGERSRTRGLHWALLASLVLHALVGLYAYLGPKPPAAVRAGPVPIEVELTFREEPKPPPPAVVKPVEVAPVAPEKTAKKKVSAPVPAVASTPQAAPPSEEPPATTAPSGVVADKGDSPRQNVPFLVPRVGTMLPEMGTESALAEAPGRTLKNGPGEEVPEGAMREYVAETTKRRLDEDLGNLVADAQRKNGLVDPYFTRLLEDLNTGFKGADVKLTKRGTMQAVKEEVIDTYTQPAERFAKTGSPLANDEQARQFTESSFGRTIDRGGVPGGDIESSRMLQAGLQSMAFTAVLKDSAARPRLKTVLMLRQDGDGALAEATVVQHSGDLEFDEFVLHLSRKVVRDQGDTSDKGGAPSAYGWSSFWQFTWEPPEVKVKLLRVQKATALPLQLQ